MPEQEQNPKKLTRAIRTYTDDVNSFLGNKTDLDLKKEEVKNKEKIENQLDDVLIEKQELAKKFLDTEKVTPDPKKEPVFKSYENLHDNISTKKEFEEKLNEYRGSKPQNIEEKGNETASENRIKNLKKDLHTIKNLKDKPVDSKQVLGVEQMIQKEEIKQDKVAEQLLADRLKSIENLKGSRLNTVQKTTNRKNVFKLITAFILLLVFITASAYVLFTILLKLRSEDTVPSNNELPAEIRDVNKTKHFLDIGFTNKEITEGLQELLESITTSDTLNTIAFYTRNTSGATQSTALDSLKKLNVEVPISLNSVLEDYWELYINKREAVTDLGLVFFVNNYQNGITGFTQWERTLQRDLANTFNHDDSIVLTRNEILLGNAYVDSEIENTRVRILRVDDRTYLIYAFLSGNKVIVATSETMFLKVLNTLQETTTFN